MPHRIALIHATALAVAPVTESFARLWPAAALTNLLDDSLSADRAAAGSLTPEMFDRFETLARYCAGCGADGILFTCSAFGPAIEAARATMTIPVLKPNEALLDEALDAAAAGSGRLALVATFEPSIASMRDELSDLARERGANVEIGTCHVPGAMAVLAAGDGERHDALIAAALDAWDDWRAADAILLAQFSMARARPAPAARCNVPVMVSTDSAVLALRRSLGA
ncbi:MAG: aspartate/glutamate racemase family protein [Betaproteobacteria bacterium]